MEQIFNWFEQVLGISTAVARNLLIMVGTVAVLVIGRVWFEGVQTVATFLGLLSAGLSQAAILSGRLSRTRY